MNSSIKVVKGKYVVHFLAMLTSDQKNNEGVAIAGAYKKALANAKPFGGRKFHNKSYGGGIAFDYQSEAEDALKSVDVI